MCSFSSGKIRADYEIALVYLYLLASDWFVMLCYCCRPATNMYAANGPAVLDMTVRQNSYGEPKSAPGPSPNLPHKQLQPQPPASFDDRCAFVSK